MGSQTASSPSQSKKSKQSRRKAKTSSTARDDTAGQASGSKALVSKTGEEVHTSGETKNPVDLLIVEPGPVVVTSRGPPGSDVSGSVPRAVDSLLA